MPQARDGQHVSRRRRIVERALLLLLLGAATTLVVAWGFMFVTWYWPGGLGVHERDKVAGWHVQHHTAPGFTEFSCVSVVQLEANRPKMELVTPGWLRHNPDADHKMMFGGVAIGWPFRAFTMTSYARLGPPWTPTTYGAITIRGMSLPIHPIWPGFLANTLLYALAWLGLARLWRLRRAWLRTRKGLCPHCAYDLRADFTPGCPECGWRRAPSPTSAA